MIIFQALRQRGTGCGITHAAQYAVQQLNNHLIDEESIGFVMEQRIEDEPVVVLHFGWCIDQHGFHVRVIEKPSGVLPVAVFKNFVERRRKIKHGTNVRLVFNMVCGVLEPGLGNQSTANMGFKPFVTDAVFKKAGPDKADAK